MASLSFYGCILFSNIMNKSYQKHIIAGIAVLLLVAVRFYEKFFFDDGLIIFFQHDYLNNDFPDISFIKTILIDGVRYWLNAILSITILYLYFKQAGLLKFLIFVYATTFIAGVLLMYVALQNYQTGHYLLLFYTRRFIIQPLLLFLLFPALWYQKSLNLNK